VSLRLSRLRTGEWLAAAAGVLMAADSFATTWFQARPRHHSAATALSGQLSLNGWQASLPAGVLALILCAGALVIWLTTATLRSPALPVVMNTLLLPLALALVVLVSIRVLLVPPSLHGGAASLASTLSARPGAWAGLALSLALYAGLYVALRREGVAPADAPTEVATVKLGLHTGESREEPHA
jgi:hypothetical protein